MNGSAAAGGRPHRRLSGGDRSAVHLRRRRCEHRGSVRRRALPRRHHRRTRQARVLCRHHGRRLQPQRLRARCRGRHLRRRLPEYRCRTWRSVGQQGAGAGADRPSPDEPRRSWRLSGHQRPKRRIGRRGAVLRRVGVLQSADNTQRHCDGAARGHRGGQCEAVPRCCCFPRTFSRRASISTLAQNGVHNGFSVGHQLGDPQAIAQGTAQRRRPDHDHRRRAGRSRRRSRRTRAAACDAARPGGHRPRCQGRRGHSWARIVLGARSDRRDGTSRGRRGDRRTAHCAC